MLSILGFDYSNVGHFCSNADEKLVGALSSRTTNDKVSPR
jgi:hypothetical protein